MTATTPAETTEQTGPTPEEVQAAEAREQALFQQHAQQAAHDYLNGRIVALSVQLERALTELAEARGQLAMHEAAQATQGEAGEAGEG